MSEFEEVEQENLKRRIRETLEEYIAEEEANTSRDEIDDTSENIEMGMLTPNSTDTQIVNKINEIINHLNKGY